MISEILTGFGVFTKIRDMWGKGSSSGAAGVMADSLIDYTKVARVEPIVLIDTDCLYLDEIHEVQQSLLTIFAGYYLQAMAISATIGNVNVMRNLDKLNPSRSAGDNAANTGMGWLLAQESYKHKLPTYGDKFSMEAVNDDIDKFIIDEDQFRKIIDEAVEDAAKNRKDFDAAELKAKIADIEKKFKSVSEAQAKIKAEMEKNNIKLDEKSFSIGRDTLKDLKELANLSVGKMFSVEITDGVHKGSMPVSIRLMASSLPSANLIHILSIGSKDDTSFKERYHGWKSGRLAFWKDLCLCQDLIDAHRHNLMADKDGIYTNIVKRARDNMISGVVTANPSIATASNLAIISSNTAEKLELHINGSLKTFSAREKVFKNTYLMILAVIDAQWGRVTFYHRGLHLPTSVSIRDLKAANKGSGPDVSDILKAYQLGNSPSL